MEEGRADASQRLPHALLRCADGPRRPEFGIKIARDLPGQPTDLDGIGRRIEIYGREHVTDTKFIGERLLALYGEYTAEKSIRRQGSSLEIKEKSSTLSIGVSKCLSCGITACVAACKKYARVSSN